MDSLSSFPLLYSKDFKLLSAPTDEQLQDICGTIKWRMERLVQSEIPKVSVVFPAYNEEMYLPLMLWTLSKLSTLLPIEIIWVNNASTDRTWEIISQSWVIRIDESMKWVSYARQAWLENAKWEIIATTDADTQVSSAWIDTSLSYLMQKNLVCFSGGSEPNGWHISYWITKRIVREMRRLSKTPVSGLMSFPGHNMFFSKAAALSVWGYVLWTDLWEDNLLARKLSTQGNIMRVDDDPHMQVLTSARRIATMSRVSSLVFSRLKIFHLNYDKINTTWQTFRDIR